MGESLIAKCTGRKLRALHKHRLDTSLHDYFMVSTLAGRSRWQIPDRPDKGKIPVTITTSVHLVASYWHGN